MFCSVKGKLSIVLVALLLLTMNPINRVLAVDVSYMNSEVEACSFCEGVGMVDVVSVCSNCDGDGQYLVPSLCSVCRGEIVSTGITNKPYKCINCGTQPSNVTVCFCGHCNKTGQVVKKEVCSYCNGSGIDNDVKGLDRIEIDKLPDKTKYRVGSIFDATGIEVVACYHDGTRESIDNYTVEGFDSKFVGKKTIVIRYFGKSVEFAIEITPFDGSGTEKDPFLIENQEQLCCVKDYSHDNFKLLNDIDFMETLYNNRLLGWDDFAPNYFYGTFDGNGHKISNLTIKNYTMESVKEGFCRTNEGVIKNLIIDNCKYSVGAMGMSNTTNNYGSIQVGAIAAYNYGVIESCSTTGQMYAEARAYLYMGGIVANNYGVVRNCFSDIEINAINRNDLLSGSYSAYVGGIVGENSKLTYVEEGYVGEVKDCYYTGNIQSDAGGDSVYVYAGGLVGSNKSKVTTCYNVGAISVILPEDGKTVECSGGVAGANYGTITSCIYRDEFSTGVSIGNDSATSCSLEQMKDNDTYAEFDFNSVWYFSKDGEYLYPQHLCFSRAPFTKEAVDNTDDTDVTETPSEPTSVTEPKEDGVLGDVNGDGKVNIKDATVIQKHIAKLIALTDEGYDVADVDGSCAINIKDATVVQKYIAGLETGYPIGKPKAK